MPPTPLVFILVAVLALPAMAAAQAPLAPGNLRELSLEQLGSIQVTTVSKQPAAVWRSAAAIFVLTSDDIRRSGAITLPEILRLVPGLQVSRLDSNHWAVGVRGLASAFSKSLLVLIDGRSVYTPLFGGVFWQVQQTLLEDIERIEVIRGPGGTIWGANAVNGVINVITRHSRDTVGTLASIAGGNVDYGRAAFRHGGGRENLHYRVYGSGFVRGAEHHTDEDRFDDWGIGQAGFRVDAARRGDTLSLQGDVYQGRAGDSLGIGSFDPPARLILSGSDQVLGANIFGRWQRRFDNGADARLQAYVDYTNREALHFEESRTTVDVDFLYHAAVGRRHNVAVGGGVRVSPSDFTPLYPTLTFVPEDRGHRFVSAFAQDEFALLDDRLWLTLGSKFEHNNFSGLEIQPSARLLWQRNERESLWTSVTRAVRTPSRVDTDLRLTGFGQTDPLAYLQVRGSADFRAERLIGVEAGYRRLVASRLYVDVTAFHNDYEDLAGLGTLDLTVELDPVPHFLFGISYENAIRGTTSGFEVAPDWRPTAWLQVRGAYSLLSASMENKPGYTEESNAMLYEGSSPRHQAFVQASLMLPRRVEVEHSYRFVSRLPARDIPRYATADARIGWQFSDRMTLAVTGRNLLQADHVEFFRDDVAPIGIRRSILASLTWRR